MDKKKMLFNAIFYGTSIILVGALILLTQSSYEQAGRYTKNLKYSELIEQIKNGNVAEITVSSDSNSYGYVTGVFSKSVDAQTKFKSEVPDLKVFMEILNANPVKVIESEKYKDFWSQTLYSWGPVILMVGFWVFFMRGMTNQGKGAMQFGKSKAKLTTEDNQKVTFKDVAGIDEAKDDLGEIIDFLKEPLKFQKLGAKIPKGILLIGPPGTGKTLLARAVAGEASVPFFSISGSEFVEMFVGVGASRVRDLFDQGKKNAPCIIFIDEIDAVGRHRGAGYGGGHDEREQTLNQLLVEMDGFDNNSGVIIIAATNRPDVLDPALIRAGRFDRQVVVNRPDVKGRLEILEVHSKKISLDSEVNLSKIARGTPGFSGADLANLINEAALNTARKKRMAVSQEDLEFAKDKVMMGSERRSLVISDEQKKTTAYHEAGHAIVASLLPKADPIHKVTIIPRGRALGLTQQLPEADQHTHSKEQLEARLAVLMGGRAAEMFFLKQLTTGASNDIEQATDIARKMVRQWGMSELGPINFGTDDSNPFLGKQLSAESKIYSEDTAKAIDSEITKLITDATNLAMTTMASHQNTMQAMVEILLTEETIDGDKVREILKNTKES